MNKDRLLGETKKLPRRGGFQPVVSVLRQPFRFGGAVKYFCSGCGSCYELTMEGAAELTNDSNFIRKYISCDGCEMCGDKFENPQLVTIP